MNVLDLLAEVLALENLKLGILPESPDTVIAALEYDAGGIEAYFGQTERAHTVQIRSRAADYSTAYENALLVQNRLDRYVGRGIAVRQISPILDIGQDSQGRREYTINFKINYTGG